MCWPFGNTAPNTKPKATQIRTIQNLDWRQGAKN
jgi:hypothetical protein